MCCMKPILCVIDLTESSVTVLKVAARIANAFKTRLTVLFPYRLIDYGYTGDLSKLKVKLVEEATEKFHNLKKEIGIINLITFEFQAEIGFASDRIMSNVKLKQPVMIVISQHQASIMNDLNSSVLEKLITNSKLPFIIVPEGEREPAVAAISIQTPD
jgi:hypothetical protein